MEKLGLYIHIPFCNKKCDYCDFLSASFDDNVKAEYFGALFSEITNKSVTAQSYEVSTIYFGGGTPSSVDAKFIENTIKTIKENFHFQPQEITIECNPESLTEEKLLSYKACGINRISVGVQSLNDEVLSEIGRLHTKAQAIEVITLSKKYFDNVSADIMLGLPKQSLSDVEYAAKALIELGVKHLSSYGLSVEEGTPLFERVQKGLWKPDEDIAVDMYEAVYNIALQYQMRRYEVSNFAYCGFESKHNYAYWKRIPYLGFGAGSHSYINNQRFNNIYDIRGYISLLSQGVDVTRNCVKLSKDEQEYEEIMLALRTSEGLNISSFNKKFNCDFLKNYCDAIEKNKKYLNIGVDNISINSIYFYIMNSILVDFLK